MAYVIGTDEAGYGPNLGPLLISASLWEVPSGMQLDDMRAALSGTIVETPAAVKAAKEPCLAIADSKALYKRRTSLRHLERGLLALLSTLDRHPRSWREVWHTLADDSAADREQVPWYRDFDRPLPADAKPDEVPQLADSLNEAFERSGVRLLDIRSRAIFPDRFNRLLEAYDSKGSLLSHATIGLAAELAQPLGDAPITVICDKHGGRNRYQDLLAEHFDSHFIEIHGEGAQRSVYRFGPDARRFEFSFQTKAESYIPPALASMASKYLREMAMAALNEYWCREVPGLKPTAGYPQDAKRYIQEIADAQQRLGIQRRMLWRER